MIWQSNSEKETFAVAEEIARQASPGDIYLLEGDLGVGKTVFAKGFARGLGITEPVTSPTFTNATSSSNFSSQEFLVIIVAYIADVNKYISFFRYTTLRKSLHLQEDEASPCVTEIPSSSIWQNRGICISSCAIWRLPFFARVSG